GRCNPGYDRIADELGVDRATVFRAVDVGIRFGWLAGFSKRGGRAKRNFVCTFPRNSRRKAPQQSHPCDGQQSHPCNKTVAGGISKMLILQIISRATEQENGARERGKRTGEERVPNPPIKWGKRKRPAAEGRPRQTPLPQQVARQRIGAIGAVQRTT